MIKINTLTIDSFRFFKDKTKFDFNGRNILIYGENGSGKSSIFKTFDFLAKKIVDKNELFKSKNIFSENTPSIRFELDNSDEIVIDENHLENDLSYIQALEIYKPMLEYKNLLKIHYQTDNTKEEINIYDMLRELFREYPIDENRVLGDIKNPNLYYDTLKKIINDKVLEDINFFLKKFDKTFNINEFFFDMEFTEDGKVEFIVNVKVKFMDNLLNVYHNFLNEAKLSALAIAIYFTIIRNVSDKLENSALKLLILDDLLISLDMSNRISLVELLKEYFNDFQIIFFTHDKTLFEISKDKMDWKSYEIYVDEVNNIELPYVKESNSELSQAIKQKIDKNCKSLDLNGLLQNAISFETENNNLKTINILKELQLHRRILFNPSSHYNDKIVYKKEIEEAIELLKGLATILKVSF